MFESLAQLGTVKVPEYRLDSSKQTAMMFDNINRAFELVDKRNTAAIEKFAELEAKWGSMDYNQDDAEFFNNKLNQLKQQIRESSTDFGLGTAYNTITQLTGELETDKEIKGKLINQQLYRKEIDRIDKMVIPEDMKNWMKSQTTYKMYDGDGNEIDPAIRDSYGNVIHYNEWKPGKAFVNPADLTEIDAKVKQLVEADSSLYEYSNTVGSGSDNRSDINGVYTNVKSSYTKSNSYIGSIENHNAPSYTEIELNKVRDTRWGIIKQNPNYLATIEQQQSYELYLYKKYSQSSDEKERELAEYYKRATLGTREYVNNLFDGTDKAMAYSRRMQKVGYTNVSEKSSVVGEGTSSKQEEQYPLLHNDEESTVTPIGYSQTNPNPQDNTVVTAHVDPSKETVTRFNNGEISGPVNPNENTYQPQNVNMETPIDG